MKFEIINITAMIFHFKSCLLFIKEDLNRQSFKSSTRCKSSNLCVQHYPRSRTWKFQIFSYFNLLILYKCYTTRCGYFNNETSKHVEISYDSPDKIRFLNVVVLVMLYLGKWQCQKQNHSDVLVH